MITTARTIRIVTRRRRGLTAALLAMALAATACGTTLPLDAQGNVVVAGGITPQDGSGLAPLPGSEEGGVQGAGGSPAGGTATTEIGGASAGSGAARGSGPSGAPSGSGGGQQGPSGEKSPPPGLSSPTGEVGPGVTDEEIAIGISLFQVGTLGDTIGVDISYGNTTAQANAVVGWVNANGGIAGRKVRPVYYTVDFGRGGIQDGQFEQEACAKWTEDDKVFAAINNTMAREVILTCLAERGVPGLHDGLSVDEATAAKYRNYYYNLQAPTLERRMRFQLAALPPGHVAGKAVGLMYYSDAVYDRIVQDVIVPGLSALGASKVVLQAAPRGGTQEAQTAVAAFQREGVTHVTFFGEGGAYPLFFTRAAENQLYRPNYILNSDHQLLLLESGAPPAQLANALGYGWLPALDVGDANDPGPVSANNELCIKIQRDAGQDMSERGGYLTAMGYCGGLLFLKQVLDRATNVTAAGMAEVVSSMATGFASPSVFSTYLDGRRHDAPTAYREFKFVGSAFEYTGPLTTMGG